VLVLLPPSEGKAPSPRTGRALDLEALAFPELTATRRSVLNALERLARGPRAEALAALGLVASQTSEVDRNAFLFDAPTMSAERLYTGVLYEALGLPTLSAGARRRARARVLVTSAAFGVLRLAERVPTYRLSMAARLPGLPPLARLWRPGLSAVLPHAAGVRGLVLDLRSGAYAAAWRPSGRLQARTVAVRVLQEAYPGGPRSIVSHANKATKGRLLRALLEDGATPTTAEDLTDALRALGFHVEGPFAGRPDGAAQLDVVVAAP
jgi:cytoplasmic iron level regulating protein YaaA (DUF328/UPF0246 family)